MPPAGDARGVFSDRQVLTADYRPERLDYRGAEIEALRSVLSPAVYSGGTATALLCGPPSQGKRTAVQFAVEAMASRPAANDPQVLPVDCPDGATAYRLAIAATNALGADPLAESGYARETAFRRLRGRTRDADGLPVLRFDRVQRVEPAEFESLLAGLLDGPGELPCAIVAVADCLAYRNDLDVETRRRLDRELYVRPYDVDQRRSILADRVAAAFRPDACPEAVLEQCCSAAEGADAPLRTALDLLRLAGDRALEDGASALAPEHVDWATVELERARLIDALEGRSRHERRTLAAVSAADDGRFDSIYDAYRRRCRERGDSPNQERSVHNYLDALVDAELVAATEKRSSAGGRYFEYALVPDAELFDEVLAALDPADADGRGRRPD